MKYESKNEKEMTVCILLLTMNKYTFDYFPVHRSNNSFTSF